MQAEPLRVVDTITAHTLDEIFRSTARVGETNAQGYDRACVILAMYESFAPRDAMESVVVGQIISYRFIVADAMEALARATTEGADLRRPQQSLTTFNRTLMSWVRQLERPRAREARETVRPVKSWAPKAQPAASQWETPSQRETSQRETSQRETTQARPDGPAPAGSGTDGADSPLQAVRPRMDAPAAPGVPLPPVQARAVHAQHAAVPPATPRARAGGAPAEMLDGAGGSYNTVPERVLEDSTA
jgi:hypothetical protein